MKNLLRIFSGLILFFAGGSPGMAQTIKIMPAKEVKKVVSKSFTPAKNEGLMIDNQYGNVDVTTWKKRNIQIDVTISAKAKNGQSVKLLNNTVKRVHINLNRDAGQIICVTVIDTEKVALKVAPQPASNLPVITLSPRLNCSIHYQVSMPDYVPLTIKNKFGNITAGDYAGALNVDEKFGDFSAGELLAAGKINLEQGSITIMHLQTGQVVAKGFDQVKIGAITGKVNCTFSSGNLLDIYLKNKIDSLDLKADNIRHFNIRGMDDLQVKLKLGFKLTKFFNSSNLLFRDVNKPNLSFKKPPSRLDTIFISPLHKDSTKKALTSEEIIKIKKLQDLKELIKSPTVFEAGPINAAGKINISVAFSVVNFYK